MDETEDLIEVCYEKGWTDGLPVVPPTPARVERILTGTDRDPDELIAAVPPKWGRATVEKVAINAVMAGCKPAYLPLILTAVEAITSEQFNLHGVQVTTSHVGPMLVVNGPIRKQLDINDGFNLFGQGWRANATIGRALRLVCTNIGGALPGELDRAAFGHAGKYTCCIAEKEEASPWSAMHVDRGCQTDDSTVTVFAAAGPQTVNDHGSNTAEGILNTIAENIAAPGNSSGETLLVIGVEHAKTISEDGFSKADIRRYIADTTKRYSEEALLIMVAGGPAGRWTIVVPGWGSPSSRAVTLTV
ncbi:hypothetical protein C6503_07570 [Candidatus Poribacteria bacterium]|nr:MAG: hypothetical protein C6503_07570 [Candidatus Poribacteria bacterium]